MRTCQEIAVAYEQSLDASVSIWTKLAIKTHFMHCKCCKQYAEKSVKLQAYLKARFPKQVVEPLSKEEKSELMNRLKQAE